MAKVTDLRHAIASKSSTDGGRGTLSDNAAITEPSEFWITIPRPAQFKPWKIAPSQLDLSWSSGGGSQWVGWLSTVMCSGGSVAVSNSLNRSKASLWICDNGSDGLLTLAAFRLNQIHHAMYAIVSGRLDSLRSKMQWNQSLKFANRSDKKPRHAIISHQISFSSWHPHNACAESSTSLPQCSQSAFGMDNPLNKFCFVERESVQAHQMKCRILLGTLRDQTCCQNVLWAFQFEGPDLAFPSLAMTNW